MAIADYDPLYQPIRGKIQGTVLQTGRNAPVIKSIDNNKGSKLPGFQLSKARLQHAATLWRQLSPADQATWNAARPDFPTVDRYGNPVLSSAYSLFLRAIAPIDASRQTFLTTPGSIFTGTVPPAAEVTNIAGAITFKSMEAPPGQNFDAAVFCTRYNPVSKYFPKPSFRQVLRLDDYSGLESIDITSFIAQEFGPHTSDSRVFWCVKTWKTGTPELVGYTCGFVDVDYITPYLFIMDEIPDGVFSVGLARKVSAYTGDCALLNRSPEGDLVIPFLDNFADLSSAPTFYAGDARVVEQYDQLYPNVLSSIAGTLGYSRSYNFFNYWSNTNRVPSSYTGPFRSLRNTDPFTVSVVVDFRVAVPTTLFLHLLGRQAVYVTLGVRWFTGGTVMRVYLRDPIVYKQFTFSPTVGTRVLVFSFSGSNPAHLDDLEVYLDDMAVPLSETSRSTTVSVPQVTYTMYDMRSLQAGIFHVEHDMWSRVLSPTERLFLKDMYSQKYTLL